MAQSRRKRVEIAEVQPARRTMRFPQHPFQIRTRPWQIAPFFIAPVLPGETMRNLLLQARAVSDPVKSKLLGWWNEYYFFYVRMRDLRGGEGNLVGGRTLVEMFLDPEFDMSGWNTSAKTAWYHPGTGPSFVKECLEAVTIHYFRLQQEGVNEFMIGDLPAAHIMRNDWADSLTPDSQRAEIADVDADLNADGTYTVSEIEKARYQWELMRTQGLTQVSYEDYLASYGVRPQQTELHVPELIRYVRDWQYPTSHVDPTDGTPTSALVWRTAERADKDRYFKEPGFLFGVNVARPKVYLGAQKGTVTDLMTDLYAWLPAVLRDDVQASWRKINAFSADVFGGNGSSTGNAEAVWLDLKDLFLYGEQFVNFSLAETDAGIVALPEADMQRRFASSTDADALFASASPANQIRTDGVVSLSIASSVQETSQPNNVTA